MREIVLASSSPRRARLLRKWGVRAKVARPRINERIREADPKKLVARLSRLKAESVARRFPRAIIIAADVVGSLRGRIIGKPRGPADARRTLRLLAGRTHKVFCGVTVLDAAAGRARTAVVSASVRFKPLPEKEIADYVSTGEPLDKAGSYALQGLGRRLVASVRGSRSAVIGLPKRETLRMLREVAHSIE